MRQRRNILYGGYPHACRLKSCDSRLPSGSGSLNTHLQFDNTILLGGVSTFFRRLLSGEGSTLSRSLKADSAGGVPTQRITVDISYSYHGVVERGLNMNNRNKQTVLVTGGTGFTGSHLVNRLISNGHDVRRAAPSRDVRNRPRRQGGLDHDAGEMPGGY